MYDPTIDSIDAQLRIARAIWRRQRSDGASKAAKQDQLNHIDKLLDRRNVLSNQQQIAAVPA